VKSGVISHQGAKKVKNNPSFVLNYMKKSVAESFLASGRLCAFAGEKRFFYMSYMSTCECGGGSFSLQPDFAR